MVNVDDDTATIAAVLNGDVQAFATIIHRYEPALLRLAISRLRNRQVAEELVQDAFLSAYKSLHTYNPQYQFRTWLWTIQLNKLHQHRLTVSRHSPPANPLPANSRNLRGCANEDDASPADRALLEERDAELHRLLEHLPEVQADSLRLRFFGELPFYRRNCRRHGLQPLVGQESSSQGTTQDGRSDVQTRRVSVRKLTMNSELCDELLELLTQPTAVRLLDPRLETHVKACSACQVYNAHAAGCGSVS